MSKKLSKTIRTFIHPDVMFFATLWMMILLVIGTVAEKYVGLYQAGSHVFSAWVMWLGFIPLPGGLATMGVIVLALVAKLIWGSAWTPKKAGIIIVHMGALLLLLGGVVTALLSQEGSMVLQEGETSRYVTDYHARELVVEEVQGEYTRGIMALPLQDIKIGQKIAVPTLPITLDVVQLCRNCDAFERKEPAGAEYRGRAQQIDIRPAALEKEDEVNKSGIEFRVNGAGVEQDGIYFSMDFIDKAPTLTLAGKTYRIALRKHRTELPFTITLQKFEREYHPGTNVARLYRSTVLLKDGAQEWKSVIAMNEPLRYKGYTFFQASFIDGNTPTTVLAVVKNAGRLFPYISCAVIGVGLLLHLFLMLPALMARGKGRGVAALFLLGTLFMAAPLHAEGERSAFRYSDFARIPVLDEGRVKPLQSFAEHKLKLFSGSTKLRDMAALPWLAECLFNPDASYDRAIFNVTDPRVVDALGLSRRSPHIYSFHELAIGLDANRKTILAIMESAEDKRTGTEQQMLDLYQKAQLFGEITRSFSLLFPDFVMSDARLAKALGVDTGSTLNFQTLMLKKNVVAKLGKEVLANTAKKKSGKGDDYAMHVLMLVAYMRAIDADRGSDGFRVIPPQWVANKQGAEWYSPWGIGEAGQGSPDSAAFMAGWEKLMLAYRHHDAVLWNDTTQTLRAQSLSMAGDAASSRKLGVEVWYDVLKPLNLSMVFYGGAFALIMASFMLWGGTLYRGAWLALGGGFVLHALGLLMRMIIMGRPPVTNLYASIVFVGFIIVAVGLVYEWRMKNRVGIITGAFAGLVLQFLGLKFDNDGDTMGMLVAVLDTNFWLATHVVCMTIGYACTLLAAVMAHVWLIFGITRSTAMDARSALARNTLDVLARNVRGVVYAALFFSAVGTILGGIWADQSWGRFWGWDPKENGALLIVLWLLFITHGRLGGRLGEIGFMVGAAMGNIAVALAWFGVNLLGVGLHSYGFTAGAMTGLVAFIGAEVAFAIATTIFLKRRRRA